MTFAWYTLGGTVCVVVQRYLHVVKWLGLSVTVRVKVRAGARIPISVLLLLFLF